MNLAIINTIRIRHICLLTICVLKYFIELLRIITLLLIFLPYKCILVLLLSYLVFLSKINFRKFLLCHYTELIIFSTAILVAISKVIILILSRNFILLTLNRFLCFYIIYIVYKAHHIIFTYPYIILESKNIIIF